MTDGRGKKYNFSGVQGINLFLIEFFRNEREKIIAGKLNFDLDDSFHSINLNINNLLILFYNVHISISHSTLKGAYANELLAYVYQSKISFIVGLYITNQASGKLYDKIIVLKDFYNTPKN